MHYYVSPRGDFATVTRSPAATWPAFVSLHLESPVELAVPRSRYRNLSPEAKNTAKRGPYFVPAVFPSTTSGRRLELAASASLVCLDIDDPDHAAPLLASLDLMGDPASLLPWPYAVYHTASSTPEAPRLRVVVPTDSLPLPKYPAAVNLVAGALGLPSVTAESKRPVQAMFCPSRFSDDPPDYSPLVVRVIGGAPLSPREVTASGDPSPNAGRQAVAASVDGLLDGTSDGLEFLKAPVEGVTLKDAEELLTHLDPDMPRDRWLRVMMALQHQFSASRDSLELFDAWSAQGDKYPGHEELGKTWNTRAPHASGRASFTYRALLHLAKEDGYDVKALELRAVESLREWIAAPSRRDADLLSEAIKKIATLPSLGPIEEDVLLNALHKALRQKKHSVQRPALKRALSKIRKALSAPPGHGEAKVPKWASSLCYVSATEEFFHRGTQARRSAAGVNNELSRQFTPEGESEPSEVPAQYLLNRLQIPVVQDYLYLPCTAEPYPQHPKNPALGVYVNIYRPDYPDPDPTRAQAAGDAFQRHMRALIAEADYRDHVVDYLAYCVQNPGAKIRHALLLQGAEGCGKSALAAAMAAVLGNSNVRTVTGSTVIDSHFNEWMAGSQFIVVEEIRVAGYNRTEAMNRLKPAITNDVLTIAQKYRDTRETINTANYLLLTNQHDSLAISEGDRRYFVVESALQTKEQVRALPATHFSDFFDTLRENAAGLRAWFEAYPIRPQFSPDAAAPATKYLRKLQRIAEDPLSAALQMAVEDGDDTLLTRELVTVDAVRLALPEDLRRGVTDQRILAVLTKLGYEAAERINLSGQRFSVWVRKGYEVGDLRQELALRLELRGGEI